MPLGDDPRRLVVHSWRELHHAERLARQPFFRVCHCDEVARRQTEAAHGCQQLDEGVAADPLVQAEAQHTRCLVEVRQSERWQVDGCLVPGCFRIRNVDQRQTVLLILVELVLKLYRVAVRGFRCRP